MNRTLVYLLLIVALAGGIAVYVGTARHAPAVPPLQQAAAEGETTTVEQLLKSGADVNARSSKGEPALVAAAQNGKSDTVRLLLQKGADQKSRDEALAAAVLRCDVPTTQLLLSGGADGKTLLRADASGKSPYQQLKERTGGMPSPCTDLLRTLQLAGVTDKPLPKVKR